MRLFRWRVWCAVLLLITSVISVLAENEAPVQEGQPVPDDDSSIIPSFLRGVRITVGPSIRELDFDYTRAGQDEIAGSMTEGMYYTYFIRVGTPYRLSKNGNWGYYLEWDYSKFSMSKQNLGTDEIDLGTSIEGYSWYITPVGFYLWGPIPSGKPEFSVITGVGIGFGYIDAKGDMILTEDGSNEYLTVDEEGFGISANLLLEAHYWNLMSRLYVSGTVLGDDWATYTAFEMVWDFGYTITF